MCLIIPIELYYCSLYYLCMAFWIKGLLRELCSRTTKVVEPPLTLLQDSTTPMTSWPSGWGHRTSINYCLQVPRPGKGDWRSDTKWRLPGLVCLTITSHSPFLNPLCPMLQHFTFAQKGMAKHLHDSNDYNVNKSGHYELLLLGFSMHSLKTYVVLFALENCTV